MTCWFGYDDIGFEGYARGRRIGGAAAVWRVAARFRAIRRPAGGPSPTGQTRPRVVLIAR